MGNLVSAIRGVIDRNEMSAKEFADRTGLLKSNLSHIMSGRKDYVGPKLIGRMVAALDPRDAETLLSAYLYDEFDRVVAEAKRHRDASSSCSITITWR